MIFGVTNSTLSMLVAFVAVSTAALPVYAKYFGRRSSFLDFAGVSTQGPQISAFVSNTGDRPGLVTGASLRFSNVRAEAGGLIEFAVVGEGGGFVVDPGKSLLVRFEPKQITMHGVPQGQHLTSARRCEVTLQGQEFNGKELTNIRPLSCPDAFTTLAAAEAQLSASKGGGRS
ncbi:MAG TPA: hypothetical protein VJS38_10535 [Phenylobacterium sp.]|uniref:hypothetical protein n=1 Tax=Phenylobacterium sp. TaxID=1871053 RepID=UPI002B485519|nr:hypothetical protein [Phenylobacterium sp.]HKR88599.1 hypothetical protein [Phenylobacterium sp.]